MGINVCEIFYSIQGESTFSGLPCVFVRLNGCNLNCRWCDTLYAKEDEGSVMQIEEILQQLERFECNLVEITGGEPLIQKDTPVLVDTLLNKGYQVLVETNGTISINTISDKCIRIVDIKCPSSGESKKNLFCNIDILGEQDEIKFVIADKTDYDFAKDIIINTNLKHINASRIHISPVYGSIKPEQLASWMLNDKIKARLSMQLHKIIWHPDKRGV
ncbi:MAG: radical SAM protein [Desulfamplus sp.]|nr:radical SAM protein [Desulfamplus sp.]